MIRRFLILQGAGALLAAAPDARIAEAAKRQDTAAVRALIAQKVDVNSPQVDGTTALHWAANNGVPATAGLLLKAGADPKATNRYGATPLALACTSASAPVVKALLARGANPNAAVAGGETALMTCARTGSVQAVEALIARGANVNAKEERRGQTALMWAAAEGHVDVIRALVKAGADLHARLDSGYTPFLFSVREGQLDAVKAMLDLGVDVNESIQTNKSSGRRLSQGGAPRDGTSALILAVVNAHFELASYLLDKGANPNAIGPGYTALHAVSWVRKPGGGDNDPAPRGSGNLTSLEMVRKLVAKGADINARMTKKVNVGLTSLNTKGATPFLLASRSADAELMRTLVSLGADPKIPNSDNSTAIIVAAGLGTRSPGEDAGTEPEVIEALQVLVDLGADINAVDENGETAMHGAAYKNLPGAVLFLASHGAKPEVWNRKNRFGWTPLTIAEGYRFGNFKPSPDTVAAFKKIMPASTTASNSR